MLATIWGLITFAGFVVALIIPKADEHVTAFWESAEEGARARARKLSSAARTAPLFICVAVAVVSVTSAMALRGSEPPSGVDIGMLVVAGLTQLAFAVAVRYMVTGVPRAMPVVPPADSDDPSLLRAKDGPRTALRFINESHTPLRLLWIDHSGSRHDRGVIAPDSQHTQLTYAGHPFLVESSPTGQIVAAFVPLAVPGTATITDTMLTPRRRPDCGTPG
ncbi:hypothetical protein [Streptomyces sp. NPDC058614]|uniref:hypothetical protein n=1 Tax=Streptomyces sp. NPDC058614 TaxID=3346557 RepID=UPI0036523CC7